MRCYSICLGDSEASKPGADLHPLGSICVVGAVQTRGRGARCVSRWCKQTCRGSDTELCGQTSFVSLAGSIFLQMHLSPCSSTLSMCWLTLPQACLLSCMPWKIWFWIYFSAGDLASSGVLPLSSISSCFSNNFLSDTSSSSCLHIPFSSLFHQCPFQGLSST